MVGITNPCNWSKFKLYDVFGSALALISKLAMTFLAHYSNYITSLDKFFKKILIK